MFLVQLNSVQQYLGQILVTKEKLLILHIVIFMPIKVEIAKQLATKQLLALKT